MGVARVIPKTFLLSLRFPYVVQMVSARVTTLLAVLRDINSFICCEHEAVAHARGSILQERVVFGSLSCALSKGAWHTHASWKQERLIRTCRGKVHCREDRFEDAQLPERHFLLLS